MVFDRKLDLGEMVVVLFDGVLGTLSCSRVHQSVLEWPIEFQANFWLDLSAL